MTEAGLITADMKLADVLERHPEVEERLISAVPALQNLHGADLWSRVIKVATIGQAARAADIPAEQLIDFLTGKIAYVTALRLNESEPGPPWIHQPPADEIDTNPLLAQGIHPLGIIRQALSRMQPGETLRVRSSFYPAPLIDVLRRGGFEIYTTRVESGAALTTIRVPG